MTPGPPTSLAPLTTLRIGGPAGRLLPAGDEQALVDAAAGAEGLSGIRGSAGATPIQNVGAYGQEIGDSLAAVRAFDRQARTIRESPPATCELDYGAGRVGISSKHTLALVNRGGASSRELPGLAREIAAGARAEFGLELVPEPLLVGESW